MQRNFGSRQESLGRSVKELVNEYGESSDSEDAEAHIDQEALDFQEMTLED